MRESMMMNPFFCLLTGYICGCFLTAELVAWGKTGKGVDVLGTKNPGMANIAAQLGWGCGALVLAGDIGKTFLACALSRHFFPVPLSTLYAGLGAALGHNFPFWRHFRGGKGVTVTCTFLILFSPLWGTLSCLAGLAVTLITGYLPVGAVLISVLFLPFAFLIYGIPAGLLSAASAFLMLSRHYRGLLRVFRGEEHRAFRGKK